MKTVLLLFLLNAVTACSQAEINTPPARAAQPEQTAPPATARAETKVYTNNIGMEFIAIPAGSFMIGADDGDAYQSEKPQHKVAISIGFRVLMTAE